MILNLECFSLELKIKQEANILRLQFLFLLFKVKSVLTESLLVCIEIFVPFLKMCGLYRLSMHLNWYKSFRSRSRSTYSQKRRPLPDLRGDPALSWPSDFLNFWRNGVEAEPWRRHLVSTEFQFVPKSNESGPKGFDLDRFRCTPYRE